MGRSHSGMREKWWREKAKAFWRNGKALPVRTNSPFLRKGSLIFRGIAYMSLSVWIVLLNSCFFTFVSKGRDFMTMHK